MSRPFVCSVGALVALAAVSVAAVPAANTESEASSRGYLVSGEVLLFSAAEQQLPAGWSLSVEGVDRGTAVTASLASQAELITHEGNVAAFFSKPMPTGVGQFVLACDDGRSYGLGELSVALIDGRWSVISNSSALAGRPVFVLANSESAFIRRGEEFTLTGELSLAPQTAKELGIELDGHVSVGAITLMGSAIFDPAQPVTLRAPGAAGVIGPDVIVSTIGTTFGEYGAVSGVGAYAVTTVSCNVGDTDAIWIDAGAQPNRHPVIGTQLYRIKSVAGSTRFEHVGMSWLKHGFCAADAPNCLSLNPHGIPGPAYVPDGSCDWLGLFATDTYSDGLNASQPGCGPRSEIQPWSGVYPFPYVLGGGASGNAIYKRLQVNNNDLDPAQNTGATYLCEVVYICTDEPDANKYNNYSLRATTVGALAGGQYNLSFSGATIPMKSALEQWATLDAGVSIRTADVPGDGRLYLGTKVTNLGAGQYHYEYALFNMNSDRAAQAISVPLASGASVSNVEFHDAVYHSGEPYSGTDWTSNTVPGSEISWATQTHAANVNANAVRWSTTYNYRFDSNGSPQFGNVTVTLFKPGTPTTVTFTNVEVPGSSCGPFVYCTTSTTSNNCNPWMGSSGSPSAVAPSGFTISCNSLEGQKNGLFFFSQGQTSTAWAIGSTSTKCVTSPVQRTPSQSSNGTVGVCDGSMSLDWNAWRDSNPGGLGSPYASGQTFYAQTWFRDPPAPTGTNLSNALGFTLCP